MSVQPPPVNLMNYTAYLWQIVTDKTGTQYQTLTGRLNEGGPWGVRVWRIPPGSKSELIYFVQDGNGQLYVDQMGKRLLFLGTNANREPFWFVIAGYVHPADCPDSTVVNINELQVASLKQSIATTQGMASSAQTTAIAANNKADDALVRVKNLEKQFVALQSQVNAQQAQINGLLTPSQVADLVWQKIKDVNYLYRLAFIAWPKPAPDQDIRDYVNDLVGLIKKVVGK